MSTITWLIKDSSDIALPNQPSPGSPLYLKYKSSGRTFLQGFSTQEIFTCECTADTDIVSIDITPDNSSNPVLGEIESRPIETPGSHDGRYLWQPYTGNRVVLTFTVPETTGIEWGWNFGGVPPIALKIKIKVKR